MTQDRRVAVIGLGYVGLPLAIAFSKPDSRSKASTPGPVASPSSSPGPPDRRRLRRAPRRSAGPRPARRLAGRLHDVRGGRDLRLRPDADHRDQGSGPRAGPVGRRDDLRAHPRRPAHRAPVDDVPRNDDRPFAEVVERSGLKAGVDFDLAFAPERVNPGDPASASKGVPRLVGATTPRPRSEPPRSCATSTTTSSSCRRRTRRSWRSSSRTSSATSTSRS